MKILISIPSGGAGVAEIDHALADLVGQYVEKYNITEVKNENN